MVEGDNEEFVNEACQRIAKTLEVELGVVGK